MSAQPRKFLKRLLSLKNVVPLLVIAVAFAGTFLPDTLGLEREQIILGLLAFLAIDSLVERLEMLSNIEEAIGRVNNLVKSQSSRRSMLRHRQDGPPLDEVISGAREIWVSGVNLPTMAILTDLFQEKAKEGARLRFLGVAVDRDQVELMARYFGLDKDELAASIEVNLTRLYDRLVRSFPQNVELRTTTHRPGRGYFIVDPHSDRGYMTAIAYLYQTQETHWRPELFLSKRTEPYWFKIYLNEFKRLWDDATEWPPPMMC